MYVHEEYRAGYNPKFLESVRAKKAAAETAAAAKVAAQAAFDADLDECAGTLPYWVRDIVRDAAAEYGVLPSEVLGDSKKKRPTFARRKAMYEVKKCTPILSSGQIGKWFQRDTTTVLFAISAYAVDNGAPQLVKYDITARRARVR